MRTRNCRTALALVGWAALAAGCSHSLGGSARFDSLSVMSANETDGMDPVAAAAYWGGRYDTAPTDPMVAASFTRALRQVENNEEALRVIQHASVRIGDHPDVLLELGKTLIANERPHEATRPIKNAIRLGKANDWSAWSAYGIALDMIGDHSLARAHYDQALSLSPDNTKVLNNKGLSYALSGNKLQAEQTLRVATATPGGTARMRQNLALVLALGGNGAEAERLARSDLPPPVANANVTYFRNLVAEGGYWSSLDGADVDLPTFADIPDDPPARAPIPVRGANGDVLTSGNVTITPAGAPRPPLKTAKPPIDKDSAYNAHPLIRDQAYDGPVVLPSGN